MLTRSIDIRATHPSLKTLLGQVRTGAEIILTEGSTPVARLVPAGARIAGLHADAIWTNADFDEPLPDELWAVDA
jgi:antitoxin (DNA-binding transcriptional repressor) of toxin-antitoxin stability system